MGLVFKTAMLLVSFRALAQHGTLPDCAQDSICGEMYERAKGQSVSGNHAEAARLYKLAYQINPDPRILFNIARMLHKDGQPTEARAYYQQFVRSNLDDPEQKRKAEGYLLQLPQDQEPAIVQLRPRVSVDQVATKTHVPSTPVQSQSGRFPRGSIALLVGGGAGLLTGLIVGGAALSAQRQVISGDGPFDAELYDRGVAMNRAAISLDVIGGALLAAGTIWSTVWWVQQRRNNHESVPLTAGGNP
jgi:tetratricopeptide (TPR) repeat protein